MPLTLDPKNPAHDKYRNMLKAGVPEAAVEQAKDRDEAGGLQIAGAAKPTPQATVSNTARQKPPALPVRREPQAAPSAVRQVQQISASGGAEEIKLAGVTGEAAAKILARRQKLNNMEAGKVAPLTESTIKTRGNVGVQPPAPPPRTVVAAPPVTTAKATGKPAVDADLLARREAFKKETREFAATQTGAKATQTSTTLRQQLPVPPKPATGLTQQPLPKLPTTVSSSTVFSPEAKAASTATPGKRLETGYQIQPNRNGSHDITFKLTGAHDDVVTSMVNSIRDAFIAKHGATICTDVAVKPKTSLTLHINKGVATDIVEATVKEVISGIGKQKLPPATKPAKPRPGPTFNDQW